MNAAKSVTATFTLTPVTYTLTVAKAGTGAGTVTSSPAGISCGADCSEPYGSGTVVTLSQTADRRLDLRRLERGLHRHRRLPGHHGRRQVRHRHLHPDPRDLHAHRHEGWRRRRNRDVHPGRHRLRRGLLRSRTARAPLVTLTPTPISGSVFTGWSGACTGTGACQVTMNAAQSVTATFALAMYTLTVTKAGAGSGTVTSSPAGITCGADCSEPYNRGTVVSLTATAATGSSFGGWTGACAGTGACQVTMDAARSVTATFLTGGHPRLSGTSTATAGRISCGTTSPWARSTPGSW